ncbi:cell envelope integrity protein CreD [Lysobacter sp. LF1]|uniref:Cell envelope integrity protein CreD n=1 Tax=Lysobacter stagni TaxID=3045172 RepID=A0ABT6XHQ6_9GAMM|nr:cell envelope integrity protein CreD [Lysobacter sp. LF1]MDI9239315.1 cell envelope integrity protein CreD [Lysobacter sp. LF1]
MLRLALKVAFVFVMTLAILIPLSMIRGVIHERQEYRAQAVADIARSYAGAQSFAGPVLVVPYTQTEEVEDPTPYDPHRKVQRARTDYWTFFPSMLDVRGPMRPDTRRRGLHEVRVFEWQGKARARFDVRIPVEPGAIGLQIGKPWLSYAIADVRGLRATPRLRINGRDVALQEGMGARTGPGLHVRLEAPTAGQALTLDTELDMRLGGTESLALVPLGKTNRFALDSSWRHPSFGGTSPRQDIDARGFRAEWDIASVASTAQRQWLEGRSLPAMDSGVANMSGLDAVGVSLIDPVDIYTQADRATKYGLLFVLLTFVGFFIFELIKQLPIHPIQYGLVGLSLAIFFLLLVSLSEHFAFVYSYLAASVACIGLLGFYLSAVLRSVGRGLGFAVMLATLYAALYGLLVSEDNALVLGAGLLFLVLATIMVVTRRVDWYQLAGARPVARLE